MKLQVLKKLPEGILDVAVTELHVLLNGPTFFSTLLHGKGHSGFLVIQNVFK